MTANGDRTPRQPTKDVKSDRPAHSPHRRPVTLLPPDFVPLDAEHERQALDVLADMLADYLDQLGAPGIPDDRERP